MNSTRLLPGSSCLHLAVLLAASFCVGPPARAEFWEAGQSAPGARAAHSAVWTGREMIVWGGGIDGRFLDTGGRYLPASDNWHATSVSNAPAPRWFHAAVWTGREMIVWGGRANFDSVGNYDNGGRYNPATDTWRPLSTHGAPSPRSQFAAVWTGRELIVWGGVGEGGAELNDGGRYDPEIDSWRPISGASGLEPRMEPTGVWTGSELIVFGGMKFTAGLASFGNGARYRPITDTWTPLPEAYSIPSRTGHTAVWTGERMLVWGGRELPQQTLHNNGAIFDLGANRWTPLPGDPYLPGRFYHAAVWTGLEMIVWGGQDPDGTMLSSGARYRPATGLWTATTPNGAAGKRQFWRPDLGVWTGEAMVIAAGSDYPASLNSTFLYFPEGEPPVVVETNCVAAPAGLIAWWRGEGNAEDAVGTHGGELLFGASFAPGRVGQAFSFDGAASRVSIPDSPAFQLTDSLSFEGWVRAASLAPGIIFFRGDNRPGLDPYHMSINTDGRLHWGINTADNNFAAVNSPEVFPVGVWTHVAGVLDGASGELSLYLNGELASQATTSLRPLKDLDPASEPAVGIGNHGGFFHNFPFHGLIDEWSLYGRALTPAEVLALYQAGGKCPPVPPTNCVPRPSGLVGWWRGEGNATDDIGHGDGTANAGVGYEPGIVGQAFRVDGVQGRISVPDQDAFKLVDALTIEAWVKLINRDDGLSLMMRGDDRPGLDPYFMGVGSGNLTFGISDDVDSDYASTPMTLGQWKHVAGTFDAASGSIKLYVDGVLKAQKTTTRRPARDLDPGFSPGLGIGNVNGSSVNFPWDGWLDEVSLYNRALSAEEVLGIYQAGAGGKCAGGGPTRPATFDLSHDFSASSNPTGQWSYGYLPSLEGSFSLLSFPKSFPANNGVLISAWQVTDALAPSVNRVMGEGTAVSEEGAFTAEQGTVYVWPGNPGSPGNYGVIRLTVPSNGVYRLEAAVRPTFDGPPAGDTDFHVLRNGHELFGRFLGPADGAEYAANLALAGGDHLDFVVGRGADDSVDHSSLKIAATLDYVTNAPPAPPTNCVLRPSGLVGWWRGEGDATDELDHGDGTANAGVGYEPGIVGQAFRVDGVQGRISVPDQDAFKLVDALTIEAWVKLINRDDGLSLMMRGDDRPGLDPYFMGVGSGNLTFGVSDDVDSDYASTPMTLGQWKHVAGTFDAASRSIKLYVDGVLRAEKTTTRRPARDLDPGFSPGLGIGNVNGSSVNFPWDGWLDEVSLYNRALSAEEIMGIYQAGAFGKCADHEPPHPAAMFDLSDDFSPSSNPAGPWSYGYLTTIDGPFSLLTFQKSYAAENGVPIAAWQRGDAEGPSVNRVMGDHPAMSEGGAFTAEPGTVFVWPDAPGTPGNFGVIRLTLPPGSNGLYQLETAVRPTFDGPVAGDTDFHVLRNGHELFGRFLAPNAGAEFSTTLLLEGGDRIDFAVGRGADGSADHSSLKVRARLTRIAGPPGTNHCVPVPTGLAAWWPFDGTAVDAVSGQTLQLTGTTYRAGMVGQGLNFGGIGTGISNSPNSQARLPASPALDVGTSDGFSIETWVNPARLVLQPLVEWKLSSNPSGNHFAVHFWIGVFGTGTLYANVADVDGVEHRVQSDSGLVAANSFQHVGMSYDKASGLVRLYLNGRKVTEQVVGTFTPETRSDLLIGYRSNLERFSGVLDELAIYRRALSEAEFAAIASAGASGKCALPPSPPSRVYDVAHDFSLQSNPNGPWSYGSLTGLDGPFISLGSPSTFSSDNLVPIAIWDVVAGHKPWVAQVLGPGEAVSDGGRFTAPAGTVYFGPNPDQAHNLGVIRFTVPAGGGGLYRLETAVRTLYDGTRSADADFHVLKNRRVLFEHLLPPDSEAGFASILLLAPGDFIDFAAGPGGGAPATGLKIQATLHPMTNAPTLESLLALAAFVPANLDPMTLQANLEAVRASLAHGYVLSAIHQLQELRRKLQAALTAAAASPGDPLTAAAQELITSLDPDGAKRSALTALAAAPTRLQTILKLSGGATQVEARAVPGASCVLERSSDLRTWAPAGVPMEVAEGLFRYLDAGPAAPNRFYRLKVDGPPWAGPE